MATAMECKQIVLKTPQFKEAIIPAGRNNRPGKWPYGDYEYITIHETDNTSIGADAEMHQRYLLSDKAAAKPVSWHYTVDDNKIIQHLPLDEYGWHAGDGKHGSGNTKSVGIEVCVNNDGILCLAYINAAWLAAQLLVRNNLPLERLKTHNWWSGKDCPKLLRKNKAGRMGWEWFKGIVYLQMSG